MTNLEQTTKTAKIGIDPEIREYIDQRLTTLHNEIKLETGSRILDNTIFMLGKIQESKRTPHSAKLSGEDLFIIGMVKDLLEHDWNYLAWAVAGIELMNNILKAHGVDV